MAEHCTAAVMLIATPDRSMGASTSPSCLLAQDAGSVKRELARRPGWPAARRDGALGTDGSRKVIGRGPEPG
jgi:hypothetical protein